MSALTLMLLILSLHSPQDLLPKATRPQYIQVGIAKHYSPGLMERVAKNRGMISEPRMAAVPDCWRIGQHVVAEVNGHRATYLIVDCSAPKDRPRHIRTGLIIEV